MSRDEGNERELAPVAEQAAHWWAVLQGENVSAADYREFADWVLRSPERVAAILETVRLMRTLKSGEVSWPDTPAEELIRSARSAPAEVVPLPAAMPRSTSTHSRARKASRLRPWGLGIAASVLLAVGAAWFVLGGAEIYSTGLGEQRSVLLSDGSMVTLNTSSRIRVTLDERRRRIDLLRGEALFQVAHELRRPFDVLAGEATVRAVGTRFNVDRRTSATTVTVVEGRVAVLKRAQGSATEPSPTMLGAAERAVISGSEVSAPERLVNVAAATAWTRRQLVFERRPLGEVAAEFNRYNRRRIEIESAALETEEVTGVFEANDPDSFVAFLSNLPGVNIRQSEDRISVSTRD